MGRRRAGRRRGRRRSLRVTPLLLALGGCAFLLAAFGLHHWLARTPRTKLTPEQARAANAAIPFVPGPLRPARPYYFHGTPAAREQAVQCLATAALYEAGEDAAGQKAVIQVVLNRVRLPQYPKTVCGVVYQGASLPTGCQFSFTCDGSQTRRTEHAGWPAARLAARRALAGYVFRPVGTATHYHTDWVVPYWVDSLAKIAQLHSHIFYRPRTADDDR
jgi:spore germination cell wall hydrolase CwlJ-like protein